MLVVNAIASTETPKQALIGRILNMSANETQYAQLFGTIDEKNLNTFAMGGCPCACVACNSCTCSCRDYSVSGEIEW